MDHLEGADAWLAAIPDQCRQIQVHRPLPSDPDPNFPFESHFEKKHIVPNPKKALQNIIGGEKRKQRLKRKEEAELERIIKSEPKTKPKTAEEGQKDASAKGYLSDWREFQARIEAKVTDSTSRLESAKWSAEPVEEKAKSSSSWANFEAHQEPQVEENWAEFAEEEAREQHPTEESFHQETTAGYSVKEEQPETRIETATQEDDWADFDNLRKGDHLTEEGRSNLGQASVSGWDAEGKLVETEFDNNWASFGALEFPESNRPASGVPPENKWADSLFEQVEQSINFSEEQSTTEKGQADDPNWFESGAVDHQSQSFETGQYTSQMKEGEPSEKTDSSEQNQFSAEENLHQMEHPEKPCIIETESETQLPEEKPKESISSQSSSFDQQSSTPSQFQNYGYDDPSSQVATEIYQSSAEEPTIMDESSAESSATDREQSNDYHYDNRMNSEENLQENLHPPEYGNSYGYDDSDVEKHSTQENSSVASSDVNELVSDVISTAKSEMAQEVSPEIVKLYTNSERPKLRNVKQGTLTENNPFRRASRTENFDNFDHELNEEELALEDEKTTLATVTLFSQSVRDEDEEIGEGAPECEVEEISKTDQDFDPFQTIYPASDKDSSSDADEDSSRVLPQISIKKKESNGPKPEVDDVDVPILPAPPKTETPAYLDDLTADDEDEFGSRFAKNTESLSGLAIDSSVPVGWETFTSDTSATDNAKVTDDELVKAFEVDWSKPPVPVAAVPEAPRSETPDPTLEIPFNPPPPENSVWRLWIRYPEKKKKVKQMSKYTTDRTWKEIAVTLSDDRGRCEVNLHEIDPDTKDYNKQPYRTLRMEPYMQLSRCKLQQYDKYGKLNIFKINHVAYRELPGMRPEKFSIKTFQHLISHKPKQNVALDHLPVYTEILKFGSMDRPLMRSLMTVLEDSLMKIPAHKDEGLNYTHEEVCCYVIDEYVGKLSVEGIIEEQKAQTRIFCSAFVNGGPHIVLGINDKWRFGREIVRRSDILPVLHDDWITVWKPEFHSCLEMDGYENDHLLKFYPLDGCKFELMRFRVSLRHNRELPMQVHCSYSIDDRKISMRCELMVPGYFTATGRSGATPCEDVELRIPVPEEWIYHFRVEKHHKMGSVHSALRKPGRIKGLERITQMAQSLLPPSLLEASIGLAKYEHIFKAIVWRIPRVPDKNEASYRPHLLTCNLLLNPHDTVPEWSTLEKDIHIEFTMPSSTVSGTTVRSISVETTGNAEKFVKYTAKYRLTKAIDYQLGHRKDKALIGILDAEAEEENSSSDSEPEEDNEETPDSQVKDQKVPEGGVAVDNLLGEGLDDVKLTRSTTSAVQPDTSQSKELADIFG
ncbi:hypothetical protein Aperf_G00000095877 [Anoplocephala perfoliata]